MVEFLSLAAISLSVASAIGVSAGLALQAKRVRMLESSLQMEREARVELARDMAALLECSREIGGRLREQAARQKSVADRLNRVAQQVDGGSSLDQVERLLADGVGVEQISRVCELSQGETALLERWSRHRSAA